MVRTMTESWKTAISATLHCLTGCAIGEVLGMVLATWWGWSTVPSLALAIALAFFFGYLLTFMSVRRAGLGVGAAVRIALAADTVSILTMEVVDNAFLVLLPGAMEATADQRPVLVVAGRGAGDRVRGHGSGQPLDDRPGQGPCGRPLHARPRPPHAALTGKSASRVYYARMRIRPRLLALGMAPLPVPRARLRPGRQQHHRRGRSAGPDGVDVGAAEADPAACAADAVRTPGTLTIGTDSPAYEPWFSKNDPTNGEGFESAVAYAVAEKLGFTGDAVQWTKVPFNNVLHARRRRSSTSTSTRSRSLPSAAEVVDFSDGYYEAAQAVIVLKGSAGAEASRASPT